MKLKTFFFLMVCFFYPIDSFAKKKRYSKRALSVSIVNGYSVSSSNKGNNAYSPKDAGRLIDGDGQMYPFFSALELARNFGRYEIGARIQNISNTFVSPFFKLNLIKNYSKSIVIPSFTLGFVPSQLLGGWLRGSLAFYLNHHSSLEPFVGFYGWYKIKDLPDYEKSGYHFHAGLRINLYF